MAEKGANTNYGFSHIHRYLNGQMTAKEMHDIERAALQDPFLADAIEGYRDRDKQQSEKHLNEITARVQGKRQEARIIAMPKRKRNGWLIAASLIFLLGIGVIFINQKRGENKPSPLASNEIKKGKTKDSFPTENSKLPAPQEDSVSAAMQDATALEKPKKYERNKTALTKKKEKEMDGIAAATLPKKEDSMLIASAPAASLSYRSKVATAQPSEAAKADTLHNDNIDKSRITGNATRAATLSHTNVWKTDKNKPFILSEVEVINMDKTTKKVTDTSSVKPEGGWLFFQDYLFGKLTKKDSPAVASQWNNMSNLELEFSVSETGSPYDVHVLHAPDSALANKAVAAIENGPKWISPDKKEKRLNIKY